MGRKIDSVLQGFVAAKCLTLLNHAIARIKVSRNQKRVLVRQMRGEIAQLLQSGHIAIVYDTKIDPLIRETNTMAAYDLIDRFSHTLVSQFPFIEVQRTCPPELKEPVASLIFAAPRCPQLAELADIKDMLTSKYGKDFATAADEMQQGCGVNMQIIELLSMRPASEQTKTKLLKDICLENKIEWRPESAPTDPSMKATNYQMDGSSQYAEGRLDPRRDNWSIHSQKAEDGRMTLDKNPRRMGEDNYGPSPIHASVKTHRAEQSPTYISSSDGFGLHRGSGANKDRTHGNRRVLDEKLYRLNTGVNGGQKVMDSEEGHDDCHVQNSRAPDEISDSGSEVFLSYEEDRDEVHLTQSEVASGAGRMKRGSLQGKMPSPASPMSASMHDMSSICTDIPASLELDEEFASRAQVIAAEAARRAVLDYARQYSRSSSTVSDGSGGPAKHYTDSINMAAYDEEGTYNDTPTKEQFSQGVSGHKQHLSSSKLKATQSSDVEARCFSDSMGKEQSLKLKATKSSEVEAGSYLDAMGKEQSSKLKATKSSDIEAGSYSDHMGKEQSSKLKATKSSDIDHGSYSDRIGKDKSSSRIMAGWSPHKELDAYSKSMNKEEKPALLYEIPSQQARWKSASKSQQEHHYQDAEDINEKSWNKMSSPSQSHAAIAPKSMREALSRKSPNSPAKRQDAEEKESLDGSSSSPKLIFHQQIKHGSQQTVNTTVAEGIPRPPRLPIHQSDKEEETVQHLRMQEKFQSHERSPGTQGGDGSSYRTKNHAQESTSTSTVLMHDNNLVKRPQPRSSSEGEDDLAAVYTPPVQIYGMSKRTGPKTGRSQLCQDEQNMQVEHLKTPPNATQQKQTLGPTRMLDTGMKQEKQQAIQKNQSSSQCNQQQEPHSQKEQARPVLWQQEKHAPEDQRPMWLPLHGQQQGSRPGKESKQSDGPQGLRQKEQWVSSDRYKQKGEDDAASSPHNPRRKPDTINQPPAKQPPLVPHRNTITSNNQEYVHQQEGQQRAQSQPALSRQKQELEADVRMESNIKLDQKNQPPARKLPPLPQKEMPMHQHNIYKERSHKEEEKAPSRAGPPRKGLLQTPVSHESSSQSHRRQMQELEEVQTKPKPTWAPTSSQQAHSDLQNMNKKQSTSKSTVPAATTAAAAAAASPPATSSPKKPPDIDVLAANFEKLKRMRNGPTS